MSVGPLTPLRLTFDYTHGHGALAPYFDALRNGRVLASACPRCGKSWCPPHLVCPHDHVDTQPCELSGSGTVVAATTTMSTLPLRRVAALHVFALVRLDGAENAMLARLGIEPEHAKPGLRVRLAVARDEIPHPAQAAWFVPWETIP